MSSRPWTESRRRRASAAGRGFVLAGVALLLLGISYAGIGAPASHRVVVLSAGAPPGGGAAPDVNVTVNLTDEPAFVPGSLTAPPNAAVHLELINQGSLSHSFTLSSVANFVIPDSWSPSQLSAFFTANGSLVNVSVAPASTAFANLTIPATAVAGTSFEFVSVVPYQFQAGMHGFLNISGGALGPGTVLNVQTSDAFRFIPDVLSVTPASFPATVDVDADNIGVLPHTFTLASQSNVTLTAGNFTAYFQAHPPLGRAVMQQGGSSNWTNFSVATPGVYEFLCEITGHFLNGMYGFLYVGVPPPANVTPPSTAIVQEGILIGAGSLLGIGVLFAVAAAYTGRFPRTPSGGGHSG